MRTVRVLGTRGVPAAHGGFETFAERLAIHLVSRGWRVIVYCQERGSGPAYSDSWQGIERIHIPVLEDGPAGTIRFDWYTVIDAAQHNNLCLTLGYNTAIFCSLLRFKGVPNIINMDGIEWSRAKWGGLAKAWFWINDWMGCWLGNHLVADHPEIKEHLKTRVHADKITTIAYGADSVNSAPTHIVTERGLTPGAYLTLVARPEPENSILEVVSGFSQKPRGVKLAVLGKYDSANPYHRAIEGAASEEVLFLGAIYDKPVLQTLRFHSLAYVHGHQVGGTNPSLVEAMGAGNAIIAHDNRFNRWVAGAGGEYFRDADSFAQLLDELIKTPGRLACMREASLERFRAEFTWDKIVREYETLLTTNLPQNVG